MARGFTESNDSNDSNDSFDSDEPIQSNTNQYSAYQILEDSVYTHPHNHTITTAVYRVSASEHDANECCACFFYFIILLRMIRFIFGGILNQIFPVDDSSVNISSLAWCIALFSFLFLFFF